MNTQVTRPSFSGETSCILLPEGLDRKGGLGVTTRADGQCPPVVQAALLCLAHGLVTFNTEPLNASWVLTFPDVLAQDTLPLRQAAQVPVALPAPGLV